MAHLAFGDSDAARSILRYLLSYHAALGLTRGTHIIDELKEEEYRNNYLEGGEDAPEDYTVYDTQTSPGVAQFLVNAPNNTSATPFITSLRSINSVQAYLEGVTAAQVVAEICTDPTDEDTVIASGTYTFESSTAGFKTIPLDQTALLTPGATYYLKIYAPAGNGRVVWYGVNSGKTGWLKAWNYGLNAYGGNGWKVVDVYTAFIIGEGEETVNSRFAQRNGETPIYNITAPNNGAAQPFIPKNGTVRSVEAHLTKSSDSDAVHVSIRTDYSDPATTIAETVYVFGTNPSGWQCIELDEPAAVMPGETYYLVLQATQASGSVIWNGTVSGEGLNSFNYDVNAFGGWVEKPYHPAFEIVSFPTGTLAQGFEARGDVITGVEATVFASAAGGTLTAEIRSDYTDPTSVLGTVSAQIDAAGEKTYKLSFAENVGAAYGEYYYLVISFTNVFGYVRVLTDPAAEADSYAYGEAWEKVGYDFLAYAGFDVDRAALITLDGATSGVQEIPAGEEVITSVRVLLSKDAGAAGTVRATLVKGSDADAQFIDSKTVDLSELTTEASWITFSFDLPLTKTRTTGNYYLTLQTGNASGNVYWHGSTTIDRYLTQTEQNGVKTNVAGEAGYEALRAVIRLISDYTQTDTTYMLIHAWVMFVNNNNGSDEDLAFIEQSYPIIKTFANYYLDTEGYYNSSLQLLYNPSLEHSRLGRYWQSYDLITNVFASQALYELSAVAQGVGDNASAQKWMNYALSIRDGINEILVVEYGNRTIYGEFYDAEHDMQFYPGISWVNFAPVAAEWFGMDDEIMENTYIVYKENASITMLGYNGLATDATLGTTEIRRELIGKGVAWELMYCAMTGDTDRIEEILALEIATAEKYNLTVYPESWTSQYSVSDPGNQEHCAWQVYAFATVFPELTANAGN